jgi:hypothetical protein
MLLASHLGIGSQTHRHESPVIKMEHGSSGQFLHVPIPELLDRCPLSNLLAEVCLCIYAAESCQSIDMYGLYPPNELAGISPDFVLNTYILSYNQLSSETRRWLFQVFNYPMHISSS